MQRRSAGVLRTSDGRPIQSGICSVTLKQLLVGTEFGNSLFTSFSDPAKRVQTGDLITYPSFHHCNLVGSTSCAKPVSDEYDRLDFPTR